MSRRKLDQDVWIAILGPFYTEQELPNMASGEVAQRIKENRIIALTCTDGTVVFPTFQIGDDGYMIEGLTLVWQVLTAGHSCDNWTSAAWLKAEQYELHGKSVLEYLRDGGNLNLPVRLADSTRWRWEH